MMFFNRSVDASGKEIIRPRVELQNSIEEQRRQRRAQRNAQNYRKESGDSELGGA